MKQYIDKSAVAAEIEKRLEAIANASSEDNRELSAIHGAQIYELINLAKYINTLEIKEVDLEKELDKYTADNFWALERNNESPYLLEKDDMLKVAKYFFELGLKAQKDENPDSSWPLRLKLEKEEWLDKVCEFLADRVAHDSIDYPMASKYLIEDIRKAMKDD